MRDFTGKRFEKLVCASPSFRKKGRTYMRCVCDCGTTRAYMESNVLRGNTTSCGCAIKDIPPATTHGLSKRVPEYGVWKSMRQRCLNKSSAFYFRYGGRGIYICKEWDDFAKFYKDMGSRPNAQTLERIDNDGPYCKENCRWASRKEQAQNRGNSVLLTHDGRTQTISAWEEETKFPRGLIWGRLADGWSVLRTLTERVHAEKRKKKRQHPR